MLRDFVMIITEAHFLSPTKTSSYHLIDSMEETILIIEDDEDIAELMAFNLGRKGFETHIANDGVDGLEKALKMMPSIIVLDLMLPGKNGLAIIGELRRDARTLNVPVIMVTARGQVEDRIAGFEAGADDYLAKPFSPKELILRIEALLRRSRKTPGASIFSIGPLRFDKNQMEFFLEEQKVDLTATEFKMLLYMAERAGQLLSRREINRVIWGYGDEIHSRTLDTHMKRLREKLNEYASLVQTVRGRGFILAIDEAVAS